MGPPPKPTILKRLEGNPGKHRLNDREPQLPIGIPKCPKHLDATAKKEWRRVSKLLLGMRVLTDGDYIALGQLCQAYSTMIAAQMQMNRTGMLFKTKTGYVTQSPLFNIISAQNTIVAKLLAEFGLTPASRARLVAAPPEVKSNKFAELDKPVTDGADVVLPEGLQIH